MQPPTLSIRDANRFLINQRYPAQSESYPGRFYATRSIVKVYRRHLLPDRRIWYPGICRLSCLDSAPGANHMSPRFSLSSYPS
jgi:hypothetical protein